MSLDRRDFLTAMMAAACSAAALPLVTPMSFAAIPGDRRFVAIVLRGAMDGLDAVQPYGDPLLRSLRANLSLGPDSGAVDLDGFYALHPAMAPLLPMWKAGELGFAQAVSTPYRDKRSHFDGQDILEAGTASARNPSDPAGGWLNRLLPLLPGAELDTAYAVGTDELSILRGESAYSSWIPDARLTLTPQAELLLQSLYENDPPFHQAAETAIRLSHEDGLDAGGGKGKQSPAVALASFAASRLNRDTRIAAFSLTGWDTHRNQHKVIERPLTLLAEALNVLKRDLGPNWNNTVVMAMTEFGRTVRENGTRGTDHGTGGLLIMAGGAIRGRQVFGAWPGLDEADLYAGRDLMPVADVRSYAGAALGGLFGVQASLIESTIFPGVDMAAAPNILR